MTSESLPLPMTAELAKRLLDALATDDSIREQFVADPAAVLVQLGYPLDDSPASRQQLQALVKRIGVGRLADKQAIAQARDSIAASLTSKLKMLPIMLDASDGTGFKRKD